MKIPSSLIPPSCRNVEESRPPQRLQRTRVDHTTQTTSTPPPQDGFERSSNEASLVLGHDVETPPSTTRVGDGGFSPLMMLVSETSRKNASRKESVVGSTGSKAKRKEARTAPPYPKTTQLLTVGSIQIPVGTKSVALGEHIAKAAEAYKQGDYRTALDLLAGNRKLGIAVESSGFQIYNLPLDEEEKKELVQHSAGKSFSSVNSDKITICSPAFRKDTGQGREQVTEDSFVDLGADEVRDLAKLILPMQLEEWMHQHQKRLSHEGRNQGFISSLTPAFLQQGSRLDWNFNEIDILAAFHQWGFPVEELGTVERYPERKAFWEWLHGGK